MGSIQQLMKNVTPQVIQLTAVVCVTVAVCVLLIGAFWNNVEGKRVEENSSRHCLTGTTKVELGNDWGCAVEGITK